MSSSVRKKTKSVKSTPDKNTNSNSDNDMSFSTPGGPSRGAGAGASEGGDRTPFQGNKNALWKWYQLIQGQQVSHMSGQEISWKSLPTKRYDSICTFH